MRKCSPLFSAFSRTKFLKAVMFSGRVMSPSPSTPPSPVTHKGQPFTESSIAWDHFCPPSERDVPVHTIIRLEELTRRCVEIFQFEVTGSFQRHAKSLCMPTPFPQNVLRKASRSCTDVAEIQKLSFPVLCQGFLQKRNLPHHLLIQGCVCALSQQRFTAAHISCHLD